MRTNVGALGALCVAIAAAIAAPVSSAAEAPGTRAGNLPQSAQDQAGASGQVSPAATTRKKNAATGAQGQATATTLGTIVVTATRRSEGLQKVPMAISALTYHEIQREHLNDFMDYAAAIPGLTALSSQPGITQLSIRGISSGSTQPGASVGIYIDNTPFGSSSVFLGGSVLTPDIDPADLERIEVLRGPQGTLYGAGALSGVLRFITIPPDTENYSGRLQVGGTSVDGGGDGFSLRGMVNAPLVTDKLAIRANAYDTITPGYIDDAALGKTDVNESRVKGGRASLLWTPSDKVSLRFTALAQNLADDGTSSEALDPDTLQPLYGDLQQRGAGGSGTFFARYRLYNATLDVDFGWATLMSSTSYSTLNSASNSDETPALFLGPQANGRPYGTLEWNPIDQTKATQEFRLTSPKSQTVEWLGGLFFTHETGSTNQYVYASDYFSGAQVPSPFGIPVGNVLQPSSYISYAAYGSVTWHITDRFDVEGGLRYSHDRQRYTEIANGALVTGGTELVTLLDKSSSDSSTTYSLTPQFHINDNNLLYLRIATGFLPGGPNTVAPGAVGVPPTFSPTKLTDYELGLKSTALDDRLIVDLSAYHIEWSKIPLLTFENPYNFLSSGGEAKSNGLEATVAAIVAPGLKLSVNAAYDNTALTKDAPFPSNGKRGDPLPYAPKFTLNLNGDYDFALGRGWNGYVGASYQYTGSRSTDFAVSYPLPGGPPPLPRSPTVPSYNTINLRAGANHDQWSIDFYVKNVTNQRGIVMASTWANYVPVAGMLNAVTGKVQDGAVIITPRLFGISVSRNF